MDKKPCEIFFLWQKGMHLFFNPTYGKLCNLIEVCRKHITTSLFFCVVICGCSLQVSAQKASETLVTGGIEADHSQLRPLIHKGKPFFPIGAYGRPRLQNDEFVPFHILRQQGWNTVLWHSQENKAKDKKYLTEAEANNFAVIFAIGNYVREQSQNKVYQYVNNIKESPALLGYYIFDEPENFYGQKMEYKTFELAKLLLGQKTFEILESFTIEKIGWVRPAIRQLDSNHHHYIFMCIAWPQMYQKLQPLCDINLPNEYVTNNTKYEFQGNPAGIVYDARVAAEAAFEAGGQGFCYTPGAVNLHWKNSKFRSPTLNEFRYSAFAPITQGAMGIIIWAGYRCKTPYTEQVVFPVTRQLSFLTPFFIGKWMNEKLTCEPSGFTNKNLKKLRVPAVSGCLRKSDDGRLLLLAVNNTAKNISASFHLDISYVPESAKDYITGEESRINNKVIHKTLSPCGVAAFIIEQ